MINVCKDLFKLFGETATNISFSVAVTLGGIFLAGWERKERRPAWNIGACISTMREQMDKFAVTKFIDCSISFR